MPEGKGIGAAALLSLAMLAASAQACETRALVPGHWEWQGDGHVWVPAHRNLPPRSYAAWREEKPRLGVRDAADDRDHRDPHDQPRDLDRRLAR